MDESTGAKPKDRKKKLDKEQKSSQKERKYSVQKEQKSPVQKDRKSPVHKERKSPVQRSPVQKSPVQKSPVQKSPVQKSPVQKSPVQKSPVQKSPVQKIVSSTKVFFKRSPSPKVYNVQGNLKTSEKHADKYPEYSGKHVDKFSLNPDGPKSPARVLFRDDDNEREFPVETPTGTCYSENPHGYCESNRDIRVSSPEYFADSDNSVNHDDLSDYSVGQAYYRLGCRPLDYNVLLYLQSSPPAKSYHEAEIPLGIPKQRVREFLKHPKDYECGNASSLSRSPRKSPKKSPDKVSPGKTVKNIMKVIPRKKKYTISPPKDAEGAKHSEARAASPEAYFKFTKLSPEYIEILATSPKTLENIRYPIKLDRAQMQYPICYKFEENDILKRECIYLRDPRGIYQTVFAKLLRNGTLFIYQTEHAVPQENATYGYDIKNCEVKKRKKNTQFRLYVKDIVSKTCLHIQTDNEKMRDKWIDDLNNFKNQKLLVEPASAFSKLEHQLDDICMLFNMQSYQILRCLGRGSFGKVFMCKNIEDRSYYAMKIMRKDVIIDKQGAFTLEAEIATLKSYNVGCVQEITFGYVDRDFVVLGMPLARGGSLMHHVQHNHKHSLKIATYYGVYLAAALIYLHSKMIIHRSLNLHTLYLDREGRLKVSDFGICVYCVDNKRFNKKIGQHPCYVAPELLRGDPYSFTVDWWAYGVCFYTMITGVEPFMLQEYQKDEDEDGYETNCNAIFNTVFKEDVDFFKPSITEEARDYLQKILEKDPQRRLGCQGNEREVATHNIFVDISRKIISQTDEPPIKPKFVEEEDDPEIFVDTLMDAKEVNITPPRKGAPVTIKYNESLGKAEWDRTYRPPSPSPASSIMTMSDLDYY